MNPGNKNESSAHQHCLLDNNAALRQNPVTAVDLGNGSQIQTASVMGLRPLTENTLCLHANSPTAGSTESGFHTSDEAFSEFMEEPFYPHSNHFAS